MHDRSEWVRGTTGTVELKGRTGKARTYHNLTQFSRACATCGKPFSIYVTAKIAAGHADSNSFGLKNCEEHRRSPVRADSAELEQLRMQCNIMRDELKGVYERDAALFAEVQQLKAKLAVYELPAAVEQEQFRNALLFGRSDADYLEQAPPLTFPWAKG